MPPTKGLVRSTSTQTLAYFPLEDCLVGLSTFTVLPRRGHRDFSISGLSHISSMDSSSVSSSRTSSKWLGGETAMKNVGRQAENSPPSRVGEGNIGFERTWRLKIS
ncbi:hypothetical protein CCACVL1_12386, partial [Corchorus capsularis]